MCAAFEEHLMTSLSIVAVAGNVARPSRTAALVSAITAQVATLTGASSSLIELVDVGPQLFPSFSADGLKSFARENLPQVGRSAIEAIEAADALVVGSPVYKGPIAERSSIYSISFARTRLLASLCCCPRQEEPLFMGW
jgi:hypothetical protein